MIPLHKENIEDEIVDVTITQHVESYEVSTNDESKLSNEIDTNHD